MLVTAILIIISVVLVVHVSIIMFKQKKNTDIIVDLYEEFMQEFEKEKQKKREKKKDDGK